MAKVIIITILSVALVLLAGGRSWRFDRIKNKLICKTQLPSGKSSL